MRKFGLFRKRGRRQRAERSSHARARDRGPAKYFHGRRAILTTFTQECLDAAADKSGTIFLAQGAPGVGKTALLAECVKRAKAAGWRTANIDPQALWDPHELHRSMGVGRKMKVTAAEGRLGVLGFASAGVTARAPLSVIRLLKSGRGPLLLVLDEAQRLHLTATRPVETVESVSTVLTRIHNGQLGQPVILLAGGLSTSRSAFGKLGISRFEGDCLVNLGRLSPMAERAVLHDWLTKDGKAQGNVTPWIDAITEETHGWPQHILSYVKPALEQLHKDDGYLTDQGLAGVLRNGKARRRAYYQGRTDDFTAEELGPLTEALLAGTPADGVAKRVILASLAKNYSLDEANRLFEHALLKGVLARRGKGFAPPIPSMHNWLVSEYGPRSRSPQKPRARHYDSPDRGHRL